ncbi:DNA polymerase LigD [Paenibacillus tarimensis]
MLFKPIRPMLLHKSNEPPEGDYIHQLKFDGFRCLLHINGNQVKLFTRHQNDCTLQFPEFSGITIKRNSAVLDGEMIVLDESGKPDFEAVMTKFLSTKQKCKYSAHFAAFDVLQVEGRSIMSLPLEKRLEILQDLVLVSEQTSVVQSYADGKSLFERVTQQGLEGIVSKKKGSSYRLDSRSRDWLKVKNDQFAIVAISGIRKREFGWAIELDGKHAGVCEFVPSAERAAFTRIAKQLVRSENKNWIYLEPAIKAMVKFQSYTKSGLMRSPSFVEFIV